MNNEIKILNRKSSLPLYEQLKLELTQLIVSGYFKAGRKFFSLSEIVKKYKVSPITARRAISELAAEGYLKTSQGKKTSVCSLPSENKSLPATRVAVFFYSKSDAEIANYDEMPWTNTILTGIQEKLFEKGALLTMAPARSPEDAVQKFKQLGTAYNAFICISLMLSEGLLPEFETSNRPYVVIRPDSEKQLYNFVAVDHYAGSAEMAKNAVLKKYRSFLYLSNDFNEDPEKMRGFHETLLRSGIPPENIYIRSTNNATVIDKNAAAATFEDFIKNNGNDKLFPLAVYSFGDLLSIGVLSACRKLGLKVPDEVGVAGSTGMAEAEQCVPSLTTMQLPMREMGHTAVDMIFRMLATNNRRLPGIKLNTKIIERESL
ncbi:MAG: substrate-binding domain-containing protein [Victivallales bacterium]